MLIRRISPELAVGMEAGSALGFGEGVSRIRRIFRDATPHGGRSAIGLQPAFIVCCEG